MLSGLALQQPKQHMEDDFFSINEHAKELKNNSAAKICIMASWENEPGTSDCCESGGESVSLSMDQHWPKNGIANAQSTINNYAEILFFAACPRKDM